MKNKFKLLCAAAATLLATTAQAALLTLTSPTVAAQPGQSAGWGFTLLNDDSANYLVVTGTEFTPPPLSAFGSYVDLLGPDMAVLAPGASLTEAYDALLGSGIGQFNFAASADGVLTGQIALHYALFATDPNGPNFDPDSVVAFDETAYARASATALPEPDSLALVGLAGVAGLMALRGRRRAVRTKSTA